MSSGEARCPLGFTGTPPIGHPSIPGMGSSGKSSNGNPNTGERSKFTSTLAEYKPSTLLIVDAIFLGLCIIAAIYRDDLKAFITKYVSYQPSSSTSSSATSKR